MRHQNAERRKHPRFAVMDGMVEPISIRLDPENPDPARRAEIRNQPALLTDLSAGGMCLIVFAQPPKVKTLNMTLNLPGLKSVCVEGRIISIAAKGATYKVGISFIKIDPRHQKEISRMAEDDLDCQTRISLRLPECCVPSCSFHHLCAKPQKGPYWKDAVS